MSKQLPRLFFSFLLLVVYASAGLAGAQPVPLDKSGTSGVKPEKRETAFYENRKHGWYWYEKEPGKKPKAEKKENPSVIAQFSYQQLWAMDPDKFQALQTRLLKKAVQHPDEKTVMDYMTLQDIARRKALAFAGVMSYVAQTHPELTTRSEYPITAPGQAALASIKSKEQDTTIRENRDHFALIMFSQEGCRFCEAQKSILEYFMDKYDWPVRYIDIRKNPNIAARFNIETTPTIIVVEKKSGRYMPVSAGVISMSELGLKLYRTIRYMGKDIKPQQWFMHDFEKNRGNDALKYIKPSN